MARKKKNGQRKTRGTTDRPKIVVKIISDAGNKKGLIDGRSKRQKLMQEFFGSKFKF